MAVDCGDKENQPPATAPAAAAAIGVERRLGVAVKKCRMKRLGRARRRVPLRDVTNLFVVDPVGVAAEWEALQQQLREGSGAEVAKAAAAARDGFAGGAAAKVGRYSLRKEFR